MVTVAAGDTLESLAKKYSATGDEILSYNGLTESTLVIGQKLIIPDGIGKAIPTPKPTKAPTVSSGGGGGGGPIHPPAATYSGGTFAWPVPGGYISQYFHYGHPALDIAAPYGSRIIAAAAGTVIFAGWKDNRGGYQVWISHGSGLYTAYYHMSAITVNIGQHVGPRPADRPGRPVRLGDRAALPLRGLARRSVAGQLVPGEPARLPLSAAPRPSDLTAAQVRSRRHARIARCSSTG